MESRYIKIDIRRKVLKASKGLCEYCKSPKDFSIDLFSFDHIIPLAIGGKSVLANIAYSCSACNTYKSFKVSGFDKDEEISFYHPRLQKWSDHFSWNKDYTKIEGITSIGKVTVEHLRLNRKELINFRRILVLAEEHPPK